MLYNKKEEILNQVQDDKNKWGVSNSSASCGVGMRNIGAISTLYPALKPCGVTKRGVRGFTLIELLVVVLIIGILAAVALPQYQKAVIKARVAEYEVNLKALADAEQVCYLRKGSTCTIDELDIDVPECKPIPGIIPSCTYAIGRGYSDVYVNSNTRIYFFAISTKERFMNTYTQTKTGLQCIVSTSSNNHACKKLGFTTQLLYTGGVYVGALP